MSLDRRVLPQDQAQYDESTKRARDKRDAERAAAEQKEIDRQNAEIDKENVLIEKTNAENEAKYQADVLAYNKELTRVEDGRKEVNALYDKRVEGYQQTHAENLRLAAANEPEINIRMGTYSPAYYDQVNRASAQTNTNITFTNEQRQSALNQYEFKMAYPGVALDQQTSQAFKSAGPKDSLIGIYEKYQGSYNAQAERSRQNALLNAGVIHSGIKQTREQSKKPYVAPVTPSKSPLYTPEMQKRVDAIKPTEISKGTIFPTKPTLAQKQQGTLTNVNTGQYIDAFNKPQTNVVANPRALVAGLKRLEAPVGTPIREKPIAIGLTKTEKIRVSNLDEFDGKQSKKVRISDPKIDAMIGAYGYEKTNEIIENYNRIVSSNNLILTKQYLDFGKSIGAKQVKVKQAQGSRIYSINALDELSRAEGEFSFIRTPEMKKEKLLQIQQTRDFLNVSAEQGFEKFEIRTPGKKTEIVFLEDKRLAAERIRAAEEGSSFKLVKTEKMKLEQKQYFENRRSLTATPFPIIIKTPEGKEILVDTTNKKEAQKQIGKAPQGSTFELGGQTPENKAIQSSFKYLDDLSLEMKKYPGNEEAGLVGVFAEGGKSLLSVVASGQDIGEQIIRPVLTGKPPTNPPIVLSSETTSSKLFPIGENWKIKSGGELLTSAKQQYAKYGPTTFVGDVLPTFGIGAESIIRGGFGLAKASPLLVIAGGKQLAWQSYKVGFRVSPYIPTKVKNAANKFGSKLSDSIPSGKLKNFAQKYPIISPRTYFDLRVVKKYTKENYPDYKNIEIIKEKGQRIFTVSGGLEDKRPNIPYTSVEPQLKASTKSMSESIFTKTPKKQVIPRNDKQGDLLFSIEFKKEFKIVNGKLNPVEKPGTLIARPSLPEMAKAKKLKTLGKKEDNTILNSLRKSYQSKKKSLIELPGKIKKVPGILISDLKKSINKSLTPPKKTKQTKITKLDWLTEYSSPEKKLKYARTKRVIITSADPDFERTALTLGMKRYGVNSFIKENPSQKFMTGLEEIKKSGLLSETAQSREGPLKLFRIGKEKKIKQPGILVNVPKRGGSSESKFILMRIGKIKYKAKNEKPKLTMFDFVGEKTILGRFYETKGGLGKAERFISTKTQKLPIESGLVVYHGTPVTAWARSILDKGFSKKTMTGKYKIEATFTTSEESYAARYAVKLGGSSDGQVLKTTLKKGTTSDTIENLANELKKQGKDDNVNSIIKLGKKKKLDYITAKQNNPFNDGKLADVQIILNRKAILSIEDTNGKILEKYLNKKQLKGNNEQRNLLALKGDVEGIGSKDFERKLGGADLYKNVEGTEPRVVPERKLTFRSPYPTDMWDSEKAVVGGSGRSISMQTQNTIINPVKINTPDLNIPTKTDYLKVVSSYKPLTEQSGSSGTFYVEEETIRYPEFGKVNKLQFNTIPKISNRTFTGTITKIETRQAAQTAQKQSELLKTVQETVQITKQNTKQKTRQIQKLKNPLAERFALRPKLLTGIVTITKLTPVLTQTPIQALKQPQKLKQLQKLEFVVPKIPRFRRTTTKPPKIIGGFVIPKEEKKQTKRTYQPGDKADFLGNVSESQISGIFNRIETTYGQKKINKLLAGDRRVVKGGSRRTSRQVEGGKKDMFGFDDAAKRRKSKKFRISF